MDVHGIIFIVVAFTQNLQAVLTKGYICWGIRQRENCSRVIGQFDEVTSCCKIGGVATTEYDTAATAFKYTYGLVDAPCTPCQGTIKESCEGKKCTHHKKNCKYASLCTKVKQKVCGTDGVTYADDCEMSKTLCSINAKNVQIAYYGECKAFCKGVVCPQRKACVHDHNGVSYCITRKCPTSCTSQKSICAADGKSYESHCHLLKAACSVHQVIAFAHLGPCRKKQTCDGIACKPGHKCVIASSGKPQCINCCHKVAKVSFALFEICGTNGKTYYDWCDLRRESCDTGKLIQVDFTSEKCKT